MADETSISSTDGSESSSEPASSPKQTPNGKFVKSKVRPARLKTSMMVNAAIKDLAERGGSSLVAIKKYISENYQLDSKKQAFYIKRYLKQAVADGSLVQTKGTGATGSFKMPSAKVIAAQLRKAKAAKAAAKKGESKESTSTIKASTISSSEKTVSQTKKQASTNTGEKVSTADIKRKTVKVAVTKTVPKSPSKTENKAKSSTSKSKPKKVAADPKARKPTEKKTAVKK